MRDSVPEKADCGVASRMALRVGNVPVNIAGMIAKYFATPFAIENVMSAARHQQLLPNFHNLNQLGGFEAKSAKRAEKLGKS